MRTCIKTIRFSLALSIIFAILTYAVSLNMEIGFLNLNLIWLSNNFALTVFGGVFTGFFVMLLCEIQRYQHIKKETEQLLFTHTGIIYAQLRVIQVALENLCKDPNEAVTEILLNGPVNILKSEAGDVGNLDFEAFKSKDQVHHAHLKFQRWLLEDYTRFVNNCIYLHIAINTDKIENLKSMGREGNITSVSPHTGKTIKKLLAQIAPIIQYVDEYISILDSACNGRFSWPLRKASVEQAFTLKEVSLSDFLGKEGEP